MIRAERIFEDGTVVADFNGFSVPSSVREKGFIAVEMKGSAEAKVRESEGLDRASFSELPAQLLSYSAKPLIFAYKYLRHPYRMVLDITKHKELPVISTVVDSASGITLFTEDGKLVHRLTYTVRNTWKQFMEVALPKDAELWGTYVNGKSVKPTKNEKEKILIPLNRSQSSEGGLAPFDVELVYFQKEKRFGWFGVKKSSFAIPDLMMSRVIWSIYLPFDYSFVHFGGTMEKEKIARGIGPLFWASVNVRSIITSFPGSIVLLPLYLTSSLAKQEEEKTSLIESGRLSRCFKTRGPCKASLAEICRSIRRSWPISYPER